MPSRGNGSKNHGPRANLPLEERMPNRIALLSFLLLAIATAGCGPRGEAAAPLAAAEPNEAERGKHGEFASRAVKVGDAVRQYRLVVPKTLDLTEPAPLVIALHGMLIDSKDLMPRYSRLNETAEKHHFLLAYPEAVGKSWGIAPEKVRDDSAMPGALREQKGSE